MPGTVKSGLLPDADRSHKCDSQEKVCLFINSPLDKGHFITGMLGLEACGVLKGGKVPCGMPVTEAGGVSKGGKVP